MNHDWPNSGNSTALYHETNNASPGKSVAVVSWMGYNAPDSPTDPRIMTPDAARAGAQALSADVNGLWVTHDGRPENVTVIGHSYGSTTVADAAAGYGMHANNAVLVGCPGTDLAHNAGDFHLDGGHVYVGDASTDPVGMLSSSPLGMQGHSIFGLGTGPGLGDTDPAGVGYGAIRFKAEASDATFNTFTHFDDHSKYFKDGSESLYNMGTIASGHGSELGQQSMVAAPRPSAAAVSIPNPLGGFLGPDRFELPNPANLGIEKLADPELLRQGVTDDHKHPPKS